MVFDVSNNSHFLVSHDKHLFSYMIQSFDPGNGGWSLQSFLECL